jgi:hypothetical protein
MAIDLINGYLFCSQASDKRGMQRKAEIARRYITRNAPKIAALAELIKMGDKSTFTEYEAMIGPVVRE